ncbi:MAG: ECF transporter S component [Acetivibrio ethanolgignens]
MKNSKSYPMILAGLFVALGIVLPSATGGIPLIGQKLLPMHLPVLLSGFVCGPFWGLLCGALTPLLRSILLGMPVMFPVAVSMAFELAAYGFLSGLLYHWFSKVLAGRQVFTIYAALVGAMLGGRVVMGIANTILYGVAKTGYTWQLFVAGAFVNALPGIIIQLILIPALVLTLKKAEIIRE